MENKIHPGVAVTILGFGLLAISSSSIFIKICVAPAVAVAAWRLSLAALFYSGLSFRATRTPFVDFTPNVIVLAVAAGLALSLHFITWITSLRYTSVASSVILVSTSPIWVALGSMLFLREKPRRIMIIGIFLAMSGSALISGADFNASSEQLSGSLLALAGALFAAIYLLIGRRLRTAIDTVPYVSAVYGTAALATLCFAYLTHTPVVGFEPITYLLLIAIAVFPQIIGHTSFNWALKYFSATVVSVITLGEPIGASILAWIILGETLTIMQWVGGVITLTGLLLAVLGGAEQKARDRFD